MPATSTADLARQARRVLDANRRGEWTCPSSILYPHQWLWDSCFVAIGLARSDPPRAAGELRALFRGQWANGMVPHMVFAPGVRDVGSRRIWQSRHNPLAPRDVETSCITQPPLPAVAVWRVGQALTPSKREAFLREMYPRLVAYHQWLYEERDLTGSGLVTLIHPWESGLDTTPPWMQELTHMREPWWLRVALRVHLTRLLRFVRRDTRYVPAAERSSDDDGLRMLVLARRAKRYNFVLRDLPPRQSVLIEDLAFNAVLVAANRSLDQIASALDTVLDPQLRDRCSRTETALEELWDDERGEYFSREATTGRRLECRTVATLLILWSATSPPDRTARISGLLDQGSGYAPPHPVPSVPTDEPEFEPNRYWKGPTWVNTNWMVIEGLRRHGALETAERLRRATVELVAAGGFSEYFSALTGEGFGADDFSWTAALTLDLLEPPAVG